MDAVSRGDDVPVANIPAAQRERARERESERETERQRDRETETERQRQREWNIFSTTKILFFIQHL